MSPANVKKWIKTQKDLAKSVRQQVRQKVKGAEAQLNIHEGYVRNMQNYLRTGDWTDIFYGEYQEHRIRYRCYALAYDKDGNPKRNVGVFYPDMGCVYTKEMYDEDRGIVNDGEPNPKRRQRNKRSVAKKVINQSEEEILRREEMEFCEELSQKITMDMIQIMGDNDVDMSDKTFSRDPSLLLSL